MLELVDNSSWLLPLLLFVAALCAGWIDAVVGGGGLIQLPALLLVPGLTPVEALATNKFGSVFGTAASSTTYYVKLKPSPRFFLPMAGIAFAGSYGGAILASRIPAELFLPIILIIMVFVLVITIARPKLGHVQREPLSAGKSLSYSLLIGSVIGFYDGLIGPGTGTFLIMGLVGLAGYSFIQASANAKIVNFATNVGALAYFIPLGVVNFQYGLVLAMGNLLGGVLGARTALKRGSGFIRIMLIVVVSALIIRLAWDLVISSPVD